MQKPNPRMTSLQASALLLSGGATDDVETAELMDQGKILDPDRLVRAHFRRMIGFDMSVLTDEKNHRMIIRDDELGYRVTCQLEDDYDNQAARVAKACIRLKKLHDAHVPVSGRETL